LEAMAVVDLETNMTCDRTVLTAPACLPTLPSVCLLVCVK
jgi:hypothetical protein